MSLGALVAVSLVIGLASVVSTLSGFGFSLMAVPLLATLVGARDAVAVASLLGVLSTASLAWLVRGAVDWAVVRRQLASASVGMPIGLVVVSLLDERALRLAIAGAVLAATVLIARGVRLSRAGAAVDVGAGFVSGVLNTSVGTSGPPVVLANQARGQSPSVFRATLAAYFTGSAIVLNPMFLVAGRYDAEVVTAAAVGLPALAVGWVAGVRLHRRVEPAHFRRLVLVLLVASALAAATSALVA